MKGFQMGSKEGRRDSKKSTHSNGRNARGKREDNGKNRRLLLFDHNTDLLPFKLPTSFLALIFVHRNCYYSHICDLVTT